MSLYHNINFINISFVVYFNAILLVDSAIIFGALPAFIVRI
jgi:hypothetical protein